MREEHIPSYPISLSLSLHFLIKLNMAIGCFEKFTGYVHPLARPPYGRDSQCDLTTFLSSLCLFAHLCIYYALRFNWERTAGYGGVLAAVMCIFFGIMTWVFGFNIGIGFCK